MCSALINLFTWAESYLRSALNQHVKQMHSTFSALSISFHLFTFEFAFVKQMHPTFSALSIYFLPPLLLILKINRINFKTDIFEVAFVKQLHSNFIALHFLQPIFPSLLPLTNTIDCLTDSNILSKLHLFYLHIRFKSSHQIYGSH